MTGRNRRLTYEYERLRALAANHPELEIAVVSRNGDGVPNGYRVAYNIRSIAWVDDEGKPLYAERFLLRVEIPPEYPSVDAPVDYRFMTEEDGVAIPHPWHPNIRYYGPMAGRVCLNAVDTYAEIAWGVRRIAQYLRYERYHALNEPPYPEDQTVAAWVVRVGEPEGYV